MHHRFLRPRRALAVVLAGVCLSAVLAVSAAGATTATCSLTPTDGLEARTVGTRSYQLYVPPGLPADATGVPLLLSMHGLGSSGVRTAGTVPWMGHAAEAGYIVAFPDGAGGVWQLDEGSTDVAFLRATVEDVAASYCVDGSRVHATGHSLGGYMAQRLACDAADMFASVAEYAGGSPILTSSSGGCAPSRGIPVALFHGTDDTIVPVGEGTRSFDEWVDRLGCGEPASLALDDGASITYGGCADGAVVTWRHYDGQGHLWPTGAAGDNIRDRMWNHFAAHPHPTR